MASDRCVSRLLPALGLALGLLGCTCAPPPEYGEYSGYSEEVDRGKESHEQTTTSASDLQYEPLTPSKYIRDFVESVFRGDADEMLDSGEKLRPAGLTANNPGFQQYWPQGEWAVTQDELQSCNTSLDTCSDLYIKYGKVCASDMMDKRSTFNTWCELQDNNCRDGTATVWTHNWNTDETITWFRVSKSPIYINAMLFNSANIILSPINGLIGTQNWVISIGVKDHIAETIQTILLRQHTQQWENFMSVLIFDWYNQRDIFSVWGNVVMPFRFEFNSTEGWMRFTLMRLDMNWADRNIAYQDRVNKNFEVNFVGVGGGTVDTPNWFYLTGLARAWLPVYRGDCKPELPTIPTEIPSNIREKINIDLYNFAGRMDEFGYSFTRVGG